MLNGLAMRSKVMTPMSIPSAEGEEPHSFE